MEEKTTKSTFYVQCEVNDENLFTNNSENGKAIPKKRVCGLRREVEKGREFQ